MTLDPGGEKPRKGDYAVGRGRPPTDTRWKPGQSGNPRGRRKGQRNAKTEVRELLSKLITIRDGQTKRTVTLLAANVLAHAVKGAKGDVRSATLVLSAARQMGLLEDEGTESAMQVGDFASAKKPRASDAFFADLDEKLLSQDEQIELSRLAELLDSANGDFTALSTADFDRSKHIVSKGRGTGITAH